MDKTTRLHLDNLRSTDRQVQNEAYFRILALTDQPVDWAYEVWDEMVQGLKDKDNHVRAISAQVLSGLAKSDPDGRMFKDFEALLAVTRDERFVTARHTMQSLWKVGMAGEKQKQMLMKGLERRFNEAISEKNTTLIRFDIVQSLADLYDAAPDEKVRALALKLIEMEEDPKYRKKYAGVWKKRQP